jgi:hypothetical protein
VQIHKQDPKVGEIDAENFLEFGREIGWDYLTELLCRHGNYCWAEMPQLKQLGLGLLAGRNDLILVFRGGAVAMM